MTTGTIFLLLFLLWASPIIDGAADQSSGALLLTEQATKNEARSTSQHDRYLRVVPRDKAAVTQPLEMESEESGAELHILVAPSASSRLRSSLQGPRDEAGEATFYEEGWWKGGSSSRAKIVPVVPPKKAKVVSVAEPPEMDSEEDGAELTILEVSSESLKLRSLHETDQVSGSDQDEMVAPPNYEEAAHEEQGGADEAIFDEGGWWKEGSGGTDGEPSVPHERTKVVATVEPPEIDSGGDSEELHILEQPPSSYYQDEEAQEPSTSMHGGFYDEDVDEMEIEFENEAYNEELPVSMHPQHGTTQESSTLAQEEGGEDVEEEGEEEDT